MNYSPPDTFQMFLLFIVQILLNVEVLAFINDTTARDTVPWREDHKIPKSTHFLFSLDDWYNNNRYDMNCLKYLCD